MRKRPDDFAEFRHRDRGIDTHPAHTIELECSYKPSFCGKRATDDEPKVEGALMKGLAKGSVFFDGDAKVWRLLPAVLEDAVALALNYYAAVYEVEGTQTTEHHTGRTYGQPNLF